MNMQKIHDRFDMPADFRRKASAQFERQLRKSLRGKVSREAEDALVKNTVIFALDRAAELAHILSAGRAGEARVHFTDAELAPLDPSGKD